VQEDKRRGAPFPDYHLQAGLPSDNTRRSGFLLRMSSLLRGPRIRKIFLKLLFYRMAPAFERAILYRKKVCCNYHGN